jgi:D-alanine-D-alanine ligase
MNNHKTVAIVFGGRSAEHAVSLQSANNIYHAIDTESFSPLLLGVDQSGQWQYNPDYTEAAVDLPARDYFLEAKPVFITSTQDRAIIICLETHQELASFDVAFPIIHGTTGEDGTLQGFLKFHRIPFVGPDVLGSAIGMDKDVAKRLLHQAGIPVADGIVIHRHEQHHYNFNDIREQFGLPVFVKPANAGSSVGVSKVSTATAFDQALREAFRYDTKILVEAAVIGKEVECAILGNENPKASIIGEIVPTQQFYSYDAKYLSADGAKLTIPAQIDEQTSDALRQMAARAFRVLCCEGMARVDFFLRSDNTFVLNEINTLPGFTKISMYPKLWEKTGLSYAALITALIELALERQERDRMLTTAQ